MHMYTVFSCMYVIKYAHINIHMVDIYVCICIYMYKYVSVYLCIYMNYCMLSYVYMYSYIYVCVNSILIHIQASGAWTSLSAEQMEANRYFI
jgi:hypothetical protein